MIHKCVEVSEVHVQWNQTRVNVYITSIQKHHYDSDAKINQMFDGLFIDPLLTSQRPRTLHMQHALYYPGLLGALDKRSEDMIYKAWWTRQT